VGQSDISTIVAPIAEDPVSLWRGYRVLRPCAMVRKITNRFRTEWGAKRYADILSVIETARRYAITTLEAIRPHLAGSLSPARQ
jgi:hypothetical protein